MNLKNQDFLEKNSKNKKLFLNFDTTNEIRVLPGAQLNYFSDKSLKDFEKKHPVLSKWISLKVKIKFWYYHYFDKA